MKILLDTHIWLWYSLGSPKLSDNLRLLIAQGATELWLSSISVWEVLLLAEKERITLALDPVAWIERSIQELVIREAPLNHQIAILSRQIDLPHQDPGDRFIAATAMHYQLVLATADTQLISAPWLKTIT